MKLTYTDNSEAISYSRVRLKLTAAAGGTEGAGGYSSIPDDTHYITSSRSQNLGAVLEIEYGCGRHNLQKPFILVEGFNPPLFNAEQEYADFFDRIALYGVSGTDFD